MYVPPSYEVEYCVIICLKIASNGVKMIFMNLKRVYAYDFFFLLSFGHQMNACAVCYLYKTLIKIITMFTRAYVSCHNSFSLLLSLYANINMQKKTIFQVKMNKQQQRQKAYQIWECFNVFLIKINWVIFFVKINTAAKRINIKLIIYRVQAHHTQIIASSETQIHNKPQ